MAKHSQRSIQLHPDSSTYLSVVQRPTAGGVPHAADNDDGSLIEWTLTHAPGSWTSGFVPGTMWLLSNTSVTTEGSSWADNAEKWTQGIAPHQFDNTTHDVGFMVYYSFGLGYQLGRSDYGPVIFNTAKSLAERFSPITGCTMSWRPGKHCNDRSAHKDDMCDFAVIIDNMMNLEVLFFAANAVNDSDCGGCTQADRAYLRHVAISHANHTALNHVRADGSTHHIVNYDPVHGGVEFACAGGGYNDSTTWARGQAWAIYGFTMAYRYTRDRLFLQTATQSRFCILYLKTASLDTFWPLP